MIATSFTLARLLRTYTRFIELCIDVTNINPTSKLATYVIYLQKPYQYSPYVTFCIEKT